MRTFAQIQPTFWTRGSGKRLRNKPLARLLALYLMTGPSSTMVGLYYISRRTLVEDTGIPDSELDACLAAVAEVGIAFYDPTEELAYVPEAARYQVGQVLGAGDRKRGPILKQLSLYGNHPFVLQWVIRYFDPYSLANEGMQRPALAPSDAPCNAPSDGAVIGAAAAPFSVPVLISGSKKTELGFSDPADVPLVADLQTRAKLWVRDANMGAMKYPQPERWTELVELNNLVAQVFGFEPAVIRTSSDKSVQNTLKRWAEGHPQASMRQAIRGAAHSKTIKDTPEFQTLATIFTDSSCVDKYARLAKTSSTNAPVDKSNRVKLSPEALEIKRKRHAGEL